MRAHTCIRMYMHMRACIYVYIRIDVHPSSCTMYIQVHAPPQRTYLHAPRQRHRHIQHTMMSALHSPSVKIYNNSSACACCSRSYCHATATYSDHSHFHSNPSSSSPPPAPPATTIHPSAKRFKATEPRCTSWPGDFHMAKTWHPRSLGVRLPARLLRLAGI